jgi:hypothetical protein
LSRKDRFDQSEQTAVQGSSNAGRSRSVQVGHPRNLSVIPGEVWAEIGAYVHRHAIAMVRAA